MSNFIDLTGQKFGKLTVIKKVEKSKNNRIKWICKCERGNITTVITYHLKSGKIKSCGCSKIKKGKENSAYKHGLSNNKIYRKLDSIYGTIKCRCYNPNNKKYKNYGGRGITICEEWKNDFMSFYNWAINNGYKEGLSIDRINVNGNYEPNNCRWVRMKEQANNKTNNHYITYNGETHTMMEWSKILNINYSTIRERAKKRTDC